MQVSTAVKRVLWVRHGQAEHNAALEEEADISAREIIQLYISSFHDSRLTLDGIAEASRLSSTVSKLDSAVGLVVSSPQSRALATACRGFPATAAPRPILVHEGLRERCGRFLCEQRRDKAQLASEFPECDCSSLTERDQMWKVERESRQASITRAVDFLHWLMRRPEGVIAVVSHSGFMAHSVFTRKNPAICCVDEALQSSFQNCEMREVEMSLVDGVVRARLLHAHTHARFDELRASRFAHNLAKIYQLPPAETKEIVEQHFRQTSLEQHAYERNAVSSKL